MVISRFLMPLTYSQTTRNHLLKLLFSLSNQNDLGPPAASIAAPRCKKDLWGKKQDKVLVKQPPPQGPTQSHLLVFHAFQQTLQPLRCAAARRGMVLWSVLSLVFRFVGLPEGPLGIFGLTQSLSYATRQAGVS